MQREEIKTFLPHREPMLLVDDVEMVGDQAIAHYHVKGDEFFLQGHFPGYPVVPGVIICEIMAQSCCILIREELEKGCTPFYSGIDGARFKRQLRPGDTLTIEGHITNRRGQTFFVEAKSVDGQLCCKGNLIFTLVPKNN